jgi:hypothetical protein
MAQTVTPYLLYEDVEAASTFLTRAFGFREIDRQTGGAGGLHLEFETELGGRIYAGQPPAGFRNPAAVGRTSIVYGIVAKGQRSPRSSSTCRSVTAATAAAIHRATNGRSCRSSKARRSGDVVASGRCLTGPLVSCQRRLVKYAAPSDSQDEALRAEPGTRPPPFF